MQIGLIGGIGPAATDFYYRNLIQKFASEDVKLEMTIAHADAPTLVNNLINNDTNAQVAIYEVLTERLKDAGADCVAVTSIAGHFCISDFKAKSTLPVVDMLLCVQKEIKKNGHTKIGILGTKPVMESKFYGSISTAEMVIPEGKLLDKVHKAYVDMATLGSVNDEQRQVFETACNQFINKHNTDAIMLGGTDLALVYNSENVNFNLIDCAKIHVQELFEFVKG